MSASFQLDTALVLTVVLAPTCVGLVILCFTQWRIINRLENHGHSTLAEIARLKQQIEEREKQRVIDTADGRGKYESEIRRKQQEIEKLHNRLAELQDDLKYCQENGDMSGSAPQ